MAINTSDINKRANKVDNESTSSLLNVERGIISEASSILMNSDATAKVREVIKQIDKLIEKGQGTSLIVNGTDESFNTSEYASRLKRMKDRVIFVTDRLRFFNYCKIFDPLRVSAYEILNTYDVGKELRNIIAPYFYKLVGKIIEDSEGVTSFAYNDISQVISWIMKFYSDKNVSQITFVFYGMPNKTERYFFELLHDSGLNFIVLNTSNKKFLMTNVKTLNLSKSEDLQDLDNLKYSKIETTAFKAEKHIEKELFSGDALGMYKAGVISKCIPRNLSCTYEELVMWWNNDMFIRPGFKQIGDTVEIPLIFSLIRGVPDNKSNTDFVRSINRFLYDETSLFIDNRFATEQIYRYMKTIDNDMSNEIDLIKRTKDIERFIRAKFGLYSSDVRSRISSAVNSILNDSELIKQMAESYNEILQTIALILVSLDEDIIKRIVNFNLVNKNPNIVVINNKEEKMDKVSSLFLLLMHKLGFDVLVFIPTGYTSFDEFIPSYYFTVNNIGYARDSINDKDISELKVTSTKKEAEKASAKKKKFLGLF